MPILRRGTTATPIALNFEGRPEFLIDAAVYPGSSGSPVFVYLPETLRPAQSVVKKFLFGMVMLTIGTMVETTLVLWNNSTTFYSYNTPDST